MARLGFRLLRVTRPQLQPLVEPQPSQTWHEPAGRILVPQVMQIGASDSRPWICSINSVDECTSTGTVRAAVRGSGSGGAVWGSVELSPCSPDCPSDGSGEPSAGAACADSVYDPVSNSRARSAAVWMPSAERVSNGR